MDKYVGKRRSAWGGFSAAQKRIPVFCCLTKRISCLASGRQVSSGHDQYANLSTSYLLREIEQYDGIAVNLLSNFDEAFLSRIAVSIVEGRAVLR